MLSTPTCLHSGEGCGSKPAGTRTCQTSASTSRGAGGPCGRPCEALGRVFEDWARRAVHERLGSFHPRDLQRGSRGISAERTGWNMFGTATELVLEARRYLSAQCQQELSRVNRQCEGRAKKQEPPSAVELGNKEHLRCLTHCCVSSECQPRS